MTKRGCVLPAAARVPAAGARRVKGVFVWSMASWDVLGVYPESTNSRGSYRDDDVVAAVQAYNTAVRAARDGQQQQPAARELPEVPAPAAVRAPSPPRRVAIAGPGGVRVVPAASG